MSAAVDFACKGLAELAAAGEKYVPTGWGGAAGLAEWKGV